jgi:hypothetical protein
MMPRASRLLWLASAILAGAACNDKGITSPPPAPFVDHVAGQGPAVTSSVTTAARILKRTVPLGESVSASATIGPRGGTLSIPRAGLRVQFPKGAVSRPTLITVTATAGGDVAYEFEPHGTHFAAPVTVRQDLVKTAAAKDALLAASLQGSYYEGPLATNLVDAAGSFARVKESRKARLAPGRQYLEFTIEHFSGYMVSTGLVSVDINIGIEVR